MGPITILDKSALQGLSRAELLELFNHYYINVVPTLLLEILGDLKKPDKKRKGMSEAQVSELAKKLLYIDSQICVHHLRLCAGSLLGSEIPMATRQIPIEGGRTVRTRDGEVGTFFDEPPEREAIRNWRIGRFSEAENALAERWRASTKALDLEGFKNQYKDILKGMRKPQNLRKLRKLVEGAIDSMESQLPCILGLLGVLNAPEAMRNFVCDRWLKSGMKPLKEFAPYAYFYFVSTVVFYLGVIWGLISTRATNQVDLEYVYYLPFCMVFVSGDALHQSLCGALMDPDQTFVNREVLKADLANLATEWASLTDEERDERSFEYGPYPPRNSNSITSQLWQRYMRPWSPGSGNRVLKMSEEEKEKLVAKLKPFMDAMKELE